MIKRPRLTRRKIGSQETGELTQLAIALGNSSCGIEDRFWEVRLQQHVEALLCDSDEASISIALDQLFSKDDAAYGALIDTIESCAESLASSAGDGMDIVLIAMPVLAWSRYQIPSGKIPTAHLDAIRVHVQAHVLAKEARLALLDVLFSPDQLPQTYVETREMLDKLAAPVLHSKNVPFDPRNLAETAHFLSDTRYFVGAVAAERGQPLFRWQEPDGTHDEALKRWQKQGHEALRALLPACAFELLPPGAYHTAIRHADRASRAYSVSAAVDFLKTVTGRNSLQLQATIGGCYNRRLEEFRIGFGFIDSTDIVHGVVWPILDASDETQDTADQIESLLRDCGLKQVNVLTQRLPMEYCDDCGAPMFPNPDGEAVHAELPEDLDDTQPQHLH